MGVTWGRMGSTPNKRERRQRGVWRGPCGCVRARGALAGWLVVCGVCLRGRASVSTTLAPSISVARLMAAPMMATPMPRPTGGTSSCTDVTGTAATAARRAASSARAPASR
eukprot:5026993-Prymnesium_polylepis.1